MNTIAATTSQNATHSTNKSTQTQTASTSFDEELKKATSTQISTASKTPEEIIAEYRAMAGGNGIFPEGGFEAQIENFTKKHEEEFKKDYPFYEKYKDVFTPKYCNYTRQKADGIAKELNAQFPEYKSLQHQAYYGGTQEDMDKFNEYRLDYQAYNVHLHDKYDLDMGMGMSYGAEGSRAYNYAMYEQLEKGVSSGEAAQMAAAAAVELGGSEANSFQMMGFMGYPDSMAEAMETNEGDKEINYDRQIDLRDQGINHNFAYTNYEALFGTSQDGIRQKISYKLDLYKILTENEALIDKKVGELKQRSPKWFESMHGDDNYAQNLKEDFQNNYKVAQFAKEIFDNYGDKIFQNSQSGASNELDQKAEITKNKIKNSQKYESGEKVERSTLETLIQGK